MSVDIGDIVDGWPHMSCSVKHGSQLRYWNIKKDLGFDPRMAFWISVKVENESTFFEELELGSFPFDCQTFTISMKSKGSDSKRLEMDEFGTKTKKKHRFFSETNKKRVYATETSTVLYITDWVVYVHTDLKTSNNGTQTSLCIFPSGFFCFFAELVFAFLQITDAKNPRICSLGYAWICRPRMDLS